MSKDAHIVSLTELIAFALLTGAASNVLASIKDVIDNGLTYGLIASWIVSAIVIVVSLLWIIFFYYKAAKVGKVEFFQAAVLKRHR
ncbi:MAG: hypothetical protein ACFFBD_23170 [Candidatus Hodarchaeota archaeon]